VGLSHLVTHQWYLIILVVAGSAIGFIKWKKSNRGRAQWDSFKLRVPLKIGDTVQKIALARWSRTFSALVSAGVPILQAIDIVGQTAGNAVVQRAMTHVNDSVKRGGTIAAPLKAVPVFPAMVVDMISIGEETGAIDTMLTGAIAQRFLALAVDQLEVKERETALAEGTWLVSCATRWRACAASRSRWRGGVFRSCSVPGLAWEGHVEPAGAQGAVAERAP